ncbi:hypothetical protein VNO77_43988 [Canavalia gladiata]|uniref:Uncharacterized protein n=1 Tax=Canavalia gladiata TaxID=3824 RepID=A0AAN9JYT2_CANGL
MTSLCTLSGHLLHEPDDIPIARRTPPMCHSKERIGTPPYAHAMTFTHSRDDQLAHIPGRRRRLNFVPPMLHSTWSAHRSALPGCPAQDSFRAGEYSLLVTMGSLYAGGRTLGQPVRRAPWREHVGYGGLWRLGVRQQRGHGRRNGASLPLSMFSGCARGITLLLARWFGGGEERWKRMIGLHTGSCKVETLVQQTPLTFSFPGFKLVEGYSWPDNTESEAGAISVDSWPET